MEHKELDDFEAALTAIYDAAEKGNVSLKDIHTRRFPINECQSKQEEDKIHFLMNMFSWLSCELGISDKVVSL